MLTGGPVFPGVRDVSDQLDKIFRVLGTPTEKSWEGNGQDYFNIADINILLTVFTYYEMLLYNYGLKVWRN